MDKSVGYGIIAEATVVYCMHDRLRSNGGIFLAETNKNNSEKKSRKPSGISVSSVALTVGKVLGTLLLVGITTCAIMACFATVYIKTVIMPQTEVNAANFALNLSSTIYYTDPQTGEDKELRTLHGGENRVWVAYEDIPENLIKAAVAIEDERFYTHHGVDWKRTAGAFIRMFVGMKDTYGGSTLTQQLIKNITQYDDVTVKRKIVEIFSALEFEKTHSKEEILEMYLNYIYFGESSYGVYTAAYTYFGKNVSELSLAECASLIGITNNPSMYDPYLSENTKNKNKERQEIILHKMAEEKIGFITEAERDAAIAQELQFQRGEDEGRPVTIYSWYEDQVIREVTKDLSTAMGWSEEVARQAIYSGGISIYSCYNPYVQSVVDEIYTNAENLPYKSNAGEQMQSAITIVDNATGQVIALAGGMGVKDRSLSFNRATTAKRPPGSSIKPLAVYSPAIEMGLITPATVLDDSPHSIEGGSPWPVNAVGYYKGLTTVYEALQNSVNTVAVKIMANYLTPEVSYKFLEERYHITTLESGRMINGQKYSDEGIAPLALGGFTDGATTLEMAAAYSTFPRNGTYIAPRTYTKVVANDGTVLIDNQPVTSVAIKESTAWYMNNLLENAVARGTGSAANFSGQEIAGKTGTTSSRKDLWFVGYTPYYTAAVWTGYDQQARVPSGSNPSVSMWKKVMSRVHEGLEYREFAKPESVELVNKSYCMDSGMIATDACSADPRGRITQGTFVKGDEPSQYCTVHTTIEVCGDSPILDADGAPTGLFHRVGPYCPAESIKSVAVVDYTREGAAAQATVRDQPYLLASYSATLCTVHTTQAPVESLPPTSEGIDPMDPSTWPDSSEYPNFNPFDKTTWPGYTPEPEVTPPTEPDVLPTPTPEHDEPVVPASLGR